MKRYSGGAGWWAAVAVWVLGCAAVHAGVATDTVLATNWVRQTSATQGTNYFMGPVSIGGMGVVQRLTITNDGGIVAYGAVGSGQTITAENKGTMLIWYPRKGAFRAGTATTDTMWDPPWNDANIGTNSVGLGRGAWAYGPFSTVSGGDWNWAEGAYATVAGGYECYVLGKCSTVGGGSHNYVYTDGGAIVGGEYNLVNGLYAAVVGGYGNTAGGNYSCAAGREAKAQHAGTFVWADSTAEAFSSASSNQFLIRATGGVGIGTNNPSATLHVAGTGKFQGGVTYVAPLGNLSMGSYTNLP